MCTHRQRTAPPCVRSVCGSESGVSRRGQARSGPELGIGKRVLWQGDGVSVCLGGWEGRAAAS